MLFASDSAYTFRFPPIPVDIRFGVGVVETLGTVVRELGGAKALLVTDPGVQGAGLVEAVTAPMAAAGIAVEVFAEAKPDSGSDLIMKGAGIARFMNADVVVGLGGGSSLDSAKAIAAMATNEGGVLDYLGLDRIVEAPLPSICIPTTSGTGSEVSVWSVLTDDTTGTKVALGGTRMMATVALCDPALTRTLPPAVTAATGMDALGHAIECYVNKACQPISGALALESVALIGRHLRAAVKNGADLSARYGMMLGSVLAGMAMNPTRLGLAHALAMPLGSWNLKIAHGTIIAITLPEVMAFNHLAAPERYAAVAAALGVDVHGMATEAAAAKAVEAVRALKADIGIPANLGACGMTEEWVDRIVDEAMKSGNVPVNPRATRRDDLAAVLRAAI